MARLFGLITKKRVDFHFKIAESEKIPLLTTMMPVEKIKKVLEGK